MPVLGRITTLAGELEHLRHRLSCESFDERFAHDLRVDLVHIHRDSRIPVRLAHLPMRLDTVRPLADEKRSEPLVRTGAGENVVQIPPSR